MWTSRVGTGYNGKEKDDDWNNRNAVAGQSGEGNSYDYGARIYNPRLGRFLSEDPLAPEYPWYTPYQYAGNMPIRYIDRDGLEPAEPIFNPNAWLNQEASATVASVQGIEEDVNQALEAASRQTYYIEQQYGVSDPFFDLFNVSIGLGVSFNLKDASKFAVYPGASVGTGKSWGPTAPISVSTSFGIVHGDGSPGPDDIAGLTYGSGFAVSGIGGDHQWWRNGEGKYTYIDAITIAPVDVFLSIRSLTPSLAIGSRKGYSFQIRPGAPSFKQQMIGAGNALSTLFSSDISNPYAENISNSLLYRSVDAAQKVWENRRPVGLSRDPRSYPSISGGGGMGRLGVPERKLLTPQ